MAGASRAVIAEVICSQVFLGVVIERAKVAGEVIGGG